MIGRVRNKDGEKEGRGRRGESGDRGQRESYWAHPLLETHAQHDYCISIIEANKQILFCSTWGMHVQHDELSSAFLL